MEAMTAPTVLRPDAATTWRPQLPVDVRRTLSPLSRGRADPTHRLTEDGALWRTTLMPTGAATYRLTQSGLHEIDCQAWGPGAEQVVSGLPELLGARDNADGFVPRHALLPSRRRVTRACEYPAPAG